MKSKYELLKSIGRIVTAINDEIDWFIASIQEKDPKNRELARFMADKKEQELIHLAEEAYERHK